MVHVFASVMFKTWIEDLLYTSVTGPSLAGAGKHLSWLL